MPVLTGSLVSRGGPGDTPGPTAHAHGYVATGLRCTTIGFTNVPHTGGPNRLLGLGYLFQRGTFLPVRDRGWAHRRHALKLAVRAQLGGELPLNPT